jgi:cytosine/adenosine deaminase-related metal-dependent hydrolase
LTTGRGIVTRFEAAGVADGAGVSFAPGSLLVRAEAGEVRVLAVGPPGEVGRHPAAAESVAVPLPEEVLIPGLVNAHTHLDLTHVGSVEPDPAGGFAAFARLVMSRRHTDPERIAGSVRRGIELSLAGGTVAVGDIAGCPSGGPTLVPWKVGQESGLLGVSFLEFFGIGRGTEAARSRVAGVLDQWRSEGAGRPGWRLGLQPHAPYTVALEMYRWAAGEGARLGLPLSTHLAESPQEHEFVAEGRGPLRELLEGLGIWDGSVAGEVGHGRHPVEHLREVLGSVRMLVAHVNDADDGVIRALASTGTSVAYCPRSSAYFRAGAAFGGHRYREMLAAGVNVCLGTDSIINLPECAGDPARGGMSVLDEMRLLHERDGAEAGVLLRMGTVHGARALGLPESWFRFGEGCMPAGLVAVNVSGTAGGLDPVERVVRSAGPVRLVARGGSGVGAGFSATYDRFSGGVAVRPPPRDDS